METGKLTIKRVVQFNGKLAKFYILLDGNKLYKFKMGEEKTFDLPAGKHEFIAKQGWYKSLPVTLNINPQEPKQIEFGMTIGGSLKYMIIVIFVIVIYFVANYLGRHYNNDLITFSSYGYLLLVILIDAIFFKDQSAIYQLLFKRKKQFYLKETNAS
jgi:hypothetical protein